MKTFINYLNESVDPNNMTEEEQIEYVQEKYYNIKHINNPSLNVQLAAVKRNAWVIQFIDNPSLEVQLLVVKNNISAILYINNPSEEIKKYAANSIDFNDLIIFDIKSFNKIQEKIKDYITKEIYYKTRKDFPWIPEIKEKFKNIDRFKRFNL